MRFHLTSLTGLVGLAAASPAMAACSAVAPSSLQSSYPGLGTVSAAILAPALSDVAALGNAENAGRSAAAERDRRLEQLEQQVAQYDAQRRAQRRPLDFRNGQSLLRGLMQNAAADPPYIATARAELKAAQRAQAGEAAAGDDGAADRADTQLATAIDRLARDAGGGGSWRMLVDADRLMAERVGDCAAWRSAAGTALPRSLAALDRYDQAARPALQRAAATAAPQLRASIAAATDTATLQRLSRDYMPTPAATAAMEGSGVAQALAARQSTLLGSERASAAAAQARRDAETQRATRLAAAEQARSAAAERALLARQRGAQGASRSGGGSGGGSSSGEPSEAQMRAALQANSSRVASRFGVGDWTKITYFEKVGCEKAQGRVGWQCDYLVRTDGNPMSGFLDAMAGPGTAMAGSARFVLRANGWDSFNDPK